MATYYISTTGSDSNDGSFGSPWATLPHALSVISGGDTILFFDGLYDEYIHPTYVVPSGSSGAPTIIAAINSRAVTWRPTDTGTRVVTLGESAAVEYVTLSGIIFDGVNQNGIYTHGINIAAASNCIIEDFELKNCWQNGILSEGSSNTYRNGSIHDVGLNPDISPSGHAIYEGGDNVLIERLEIYNVPGWGIQLQYTTCFNCEVRYNDIHDSGTINGGGVVLSSFTASGPAAHDNFVHDNLIHDNTGSGIWVGGGGVEIAHDHRVYNNTIYNCGSIGLRFGLAEDNLVINNIIYLNVVNFQDDSGMSNTITNNLVGTDPSFVDAGSGDFHLQSGSVARDAGATIVEITQDYEGNLRPQGGFYDIGAYEFFTGSFNATITPSVGSLSIGTQSPTIGRSVQLTPSAGTLSITGQIPAGFSQQIRPSVGALSITGKIPPNFSQIITPDTGSATFTGQLPDTLKTNTRIIPNTGAMNLTGTQYSGFEHGESYPGSDDPTLEVQNVSVFDRTSPKAAADVGTALATVVYSKSIPGGTLKTRNCLYFVLQLGTCSLFRRPCPDDDEPGEQALSEVAIFPNDPNGTAGNQRSGWSMIDVEPDSQTEIIYQRYTNGFGIGGSGRTYKITDTTTITAIDSSDDEGGGAFSNCFGGIADVPMWLGYYSIGGAHVTFGLNFIDASNNTVTQAANGLGPLVTSTLWTYNNNIYYSFMGQDSIGGSGATALRSIDLSNKGSPLFGAQNTTDFNGSVWITSCHATNTFLYAMAWNYVPSSFRILKLNKSSLAIVDVFDISASDAAGNHETIFAVSDDLIYFTASNGIGFPLAVYYWAGGAAGHMGLVDADVSGFSGWANGGLFSSFPSYKQMYVTTVGNAQYLYLGGSGQNGNKVRISKIGPIFCHTR